MSEEAGTPTSNNAGNTTGGTTFTTTGGLVPGTTTATPAAVEVKTEIPVENQVGEWKRKAEKAEKEAADLRAWREEQETAKLTEIEKANKAATDAEARATAAEDKALKLERSSWVRKAAREAGFVDPSDAVLDLDLTTLEDADAAEKAVKALAEKKPHWLSQSKPSGFGTIGDAGRRSETPPLGEDGKPDMKAGLGKELMNGLLGGGKR